LCTELSDLTLYSNLQATRESLLREDISRLQHTLERCVGVDGGPPSPTDRNSDVAAFLSPPTPSAQRRLNLSVGSISAQIGRLEVERDALHASLACADADGARADEQLQSVRQLLSQSRAEQHQLLAALRERERALHETRQFAAALHVRVARSDSDAAAERASLHEAALSSEELSSAYRDAQRVVARQHAAAVEQLRAVKRAAGLRMARAAVDGAARCALRAWRHAVERALLLRQIRALSRPSARPSEPPSPGVVGASSMAMALAALADAPLLSDGEQPLADESASSSSSSSSESRAEHEQGAREPTTTAVASGERGERRAAYVDHEEAARSTRMRRWWSAELRALTNELQLADAELSRAADRARDERAAHCGLLAESSEVGRRADAECACALRTLLEIDEMLSRGVGAFRSSAQQLSVLARALADADSQLADADAHARGLELAVADGKVEVELRSRKSEIMVRELQRSLREEVAAHARTRDESSAHADEAALAAAAATAAAVEAAREEAMSAVATGMTDALAAALPARPPIAVRPSSDGGAATCAAAVAASAPGRVGSLPAAASPRGAPAGGESGAWGELSRAQSSLEVDGPSAPSSSWLHAVGLGGSWSAVEPAGVSGASAHTLAFVEGAMMRASADSVSPDSLLLKLRHLSAQNGFLRERVSHLEGCVLELHTDLDKKKALMCARPAHDAPAAAAAAHRHSGQFSSARDRPRACTHSALRCPLLPVPRSPGPRCCARAGAISTRSPTDRFRRTRVMTSRVRSSSAGCRHSSSRR
jgi:hypothetical protein